MDRPQLPGHRQGPGGVDVRELLDPAYLETPARKRTHSERLEEAWIQARGVDTEISLDERRDLSDRSLVEDEVVGFHEGGFTPFESRVDNLITTGQENTLLLRVVGHLPRTVHQQMVLRRFPLASVVLGIVHSIDFRFTARLSHTAQADIR